MIVDASTALLIPMLGPAGGLIVGFILGMILHRRFVMGAVADADLAREQAIEIHRRVADDAIETHRQITAGLTAEFTSYRERSSADQARSDERFAAVNRRLDECRVESHELLGRVAALEARQIARPT